MDRQRIQNCLSSYSPMRDIVQNTDIINSVVKLIAHLVL